jgi:hypothetical protein
MLQVLDRTPPIVVHKQSMTIIDGHHRAEAARRAGATHLEAILIELPTSAAMLLAVLANTTHGKPLSVRDRAGAASDLREIYPNISDRHLAAICGLTLASGLCTGASSMPALPERAGGRRLAQRLGISASTMSRLGSPRITSVSSTPGDRLQGAANECRAKAEMWLELADELERRAQSEG